MHNFRELNIWKEGVDLAVSVNTVCNSFPEYETFGISSQLRRCSVSIPSNISEGSSRVSNKDFVRFLRISLGSAFELETQLTISAKLDYIEDQHELFEQLNKQQRKIHNFIKKIENNTNR